MKTVCDINKCNGCAVCLSVCAKNCISIVDSVKTINAEIDELRCVNCKLCEKTCPNISAPKKTKPIEWKQGWANPNIRNNSTSGGAASAILQYFIESGGFVASCLFKDGQFTFELTNDINVAKRFAGSKYVKSNPDGIYKRIQNKLKTDKVLFVGLPCQVAGVKNFIKNQDNLYTIDILCHGTPSAKTLELFLDEKDIKITELDNIKFRTDSTTNPLEITMDTYSIAFLNSIFCTENCYSCNYTSVERVSDISLGDSWGTEYKDEEKNGVSLILVQTEKGKELLSKSHLELRDVDLDVAVSNNQPLREHIGMPKEREKFLEYLKSGYKFSTALKKTVPKIMLKQKVKRILTRLRVIKEKDKYRISVFASQQPK